MNSKAVLRIDLIELAHDCIAGDFCENRCRGNGQTEFVALDDGFLSGNRTGARCESLQQLAAYSFVSVDEDTIRSGLQCCARLHHRKKTRVQNVNAIDFLDGDNSNAEADCMFSDKDGRLFAP